MRLYKLSADEKRLACALSDIGVDESALRMVEKGISLNILVKDIKSPAANILKQEALASGMDVAVRRGVVSCSVEYSDALMMGSRNSFLRLIKRLKRQPFGLSGLALDIEKILVLKKRDYFIACGRRISLSEPIVMGILNVTPDSFSDGGFYTDPQEAEKHVKRMVDEGAGIIDIGGMSSRPGASYVSAEEEIKRIKDILRHTVSAYGVPVSIDTCNYETAASAVACGAVIVNDITGLASNDMVRVCADSGVAVCIMHMKGNPETMQKDTSYKNIISGIKDFFSERIEKAVKAGIMEESIILDVGFGFGKSTEQNWTLLKYLNEFEVFGMPLLVGISKKSMIGAATGKNASERLAGTVAAGAIALFAGADILRVHDVAYGVDTVKVINAVMKAEAR